MLKIDLRPEENVLRLFGFFSVAGFTIMALVFRWQWDIPGWLFWGLIGLGVFLAMSAWLELINAIRPVYVVMSVIGMVIGMILGPIILGIMYYGMFTPLALWFRIVGRNSMERRLQPDAETYWRVREGTSRPSRYLRLY